AIIEFDGLNFSGNDLELARRYCAREEFFHLRRHPVAVNIPPCPCVSQESTAGWRAETLPQLLGERPNAIYHATPVAALLLGSSRHLAKPGGQFGDIASKRNINPIYW